VKIKELRLEKHLTQREAASLVGISLRTYQNH
jgi:Helix-turn-helix.